MLIGSRRIPEHVVAMVPQQPRLPREPHPGIPASFPRWPVPVGEGQSMVDRTDHYIGGTPRLLNHRAGGRSAVLDEVYSTSPAQYSFLKSRLFKKGKQAISHSALVQQTGPHFSIGVNTGAQLKGT